MTGRLELFCCLVKEIPGNLGSMAGVIGLVGAGGGGVASEVAPIQDDFGEDADRGAALAAEGDGLVVFGLIGGGRGGHREGDLEGLGVDHAQIRERGLDLVVAGLRQAVGPLACGIVRVDVRVFGGVGDDGDMVSSRVDWQGV